MSDIECGIALEDGSKIYKMWSDFFEKEVEVFIALSDDTRTISFRASDVAKKLGIPSNRVAMFLNRHKSKISGIYQSGSIFDKPAHTYGLKSGSYFVTLQAAQEVEKHFGARLEVLPDESTTITNVEEHHPIQNQSSFVSSSSSAKQLQVDQKMYYPKFLDSAFQAKGKEKDETPDYFESPEEEQGSALPGAISPYSKSAGYESYSQYPISSPFSAGHVLPTSFMLASPTSSVASPSSYSSYSLEHQQRQQQQQQAQQQQQQQQAIMEAGTSGDQYGWLQPVVYFQMPTFTAMQYSNASPLSESNSAGMSAYSPHYDPNVLQVPYFYNVNQQSPQPQAQPQPHRRLV